MFRCQKCGKQSLSKEKQTKIVLQTRMVKHPFREKGQPDGSNDPGGFGSQIVKEQILGSCCA